MPSVVREAARHELPSTLRVQSTIGGCIASGDPDSELLATLLVHDGRVHLAQTSGSVEVPLDELLAELPLASGRIITAVSIDARGVSSLMRTGRTPADRPGPSSPSWRASPARRTALGGNHRRGNHAGSHGLHGRRWRQPAPLLERASQRAIRTGLPGSSRSAISEARASTAEPWRGS